MGKHPHIIIYSLIVFVVITGVALTSVQILFRRQIDNLEHQARWEALETGNFLADELGKTLIPLRSLQQAVVYSTFFQNLPRQIGNYGLIDSAPEMFGPGSTTMKDYRNVTGICDDPLLKEKFNEIVSGITSNFAFDGIIVNYRLAPYGVFCLVDPIVNTKDFSDEFPMNNTAQIGWDPINSPSEIWRNRLRRVYDAKNEIIVFGPMHDFVMDGVEMFCAHLAVNFPSYNYTLDGESQSTFGFVMHFIHWSNLKEASGIDARFNAKELDYRLSRTDQIVHSDDGMAMPHVSSVLHLTHGRTRIYNQTLQTSHYCPIPLQRVILATNMKSTEEINHHDQLHKHSSISASVTIRSPTGEEWTMQVSHQCNIWKQIVYLRIAAVLAGFIVTIMFAMILLERQLHSLLLYKIMPEEAIKKLKNERKTQFCRFWHYLMFS
jgi:D-ribose pyranose/furanose isomerase RbsD